MQNPEFCIDCERSHANQRELFPVGATVLLFDTAVTEVVAHCVDGRAVLRFENGELHTFHQLDKAIRSTERIVQVSVTVDCRHEHVRAQEITHDMPLL